MLHKIKSINEKIENGIIKKTDFFPLLAKCDEAVCDFVEKKGTTYILPYDELKFDTDNRLKTVLNKQKEFVRNPVITIQENIKTKFQYLNEFLSKYHIGFAQKVKINEYGTVSVELSCIIMCNASTSKMLSEKNISRTKSHF